MCMGDGGMIHINLMKPFVTLIYPPELATDKKHREFTKKLLEEGEADLTIGYMELSLAKPGRLVYCTLVEDEE